MLFHYWYTTISMHSEKGEGGRELDVVFFLVVYHLPRLNSSVSYPNRFDRLSKQNRQIFC